MPSVILPFVSQEFALQQWLTDNSGNVSVCLSIGDTTPDANTVLGDFTEASFPGYFRQALTINPPAADPPNNRSTVGPLPFAFGGPTDYSSNSIFCVFLICPGDVSIDLVASWRLDGAPQVVAAPTDYVSGVLTLTAADLTAIAHHFEVLITLYAGGDVFVIGQSNSATISAVDANGTIDPEWEGVVVLGLAVLGPPGTGSGDCWISANGGEATNVASVSLSGGTGVIPNFYYVRDSGGSDTIPVVVVATDALISGISRMVAGPM